MKDTIIFWIYLSVFLVIADLVAIGVFNAHLSLASYLIGMAVGFAICQHGDGS